MKTKEEASKIVKLLANEYPDAKPELKFSSPYELLVAVILSAQCTDKRVNEVTSVLFALHNTPEKMLTLETEELEQIIKPCGLFRAKAKNILAATRKIVDIHNGQVPENFDELLKLDGVGRKTANVVSSVAFNRDAIAVDTHVFRVSRRIGFSNAETPNGVEKDLNELIDKKLWSRAHHYLIFHGRRVCKAVTPECSHCVIKKHCEKNGVVKSK